ncbi:MAG: hypothetical protein JW893_01220 [Candidatus Omnitrophica bacterium]|nr:hypothetical protein [Candidatus Omnitrophota bacterium]
MRPIMDVHARIRDMIQKDPRIKYVPVVVMMENSWPVPWLFSFFTNAGYYGSAMKGRRDAAILFCDSAERGPLEVVLKEKYFYEQILFREFYGGELRIYYQYDLFKDFLEDELPVFEPLEIPLPGPGEGYIQRIYDNAEWQGKPVFERNVLRIQQSWDNRDRPWPAPFGMIFESEIYVPEEGEYEFFLASDDGSDLEIAKEKVVDNLGAHPERIVSGEKFLKKGWHPLKIRYNDIGGGGMIRYWWKPPGKKEEDLPVEYTRVREV